MSNNIVEFTDAAVVHIRKIMERRGSGVGFRLSVKQAGCTGYKYQPEIVDEILSNDEQFITPQGLTVCIDPHCITMIRGTTVDYVVKGFNQQLVFLNPNIESECGCGESFFVAEKASNSGDNHE